MTALRAVFLGNDPWSVPTLDDLAKAPDVPIASVITNPARPAGRGARRRPTAVADAAARLHLGVLEVEGVREGAGREAIERMRPDVLVVVAYGHILPAEILAIPRFGSVNLHFSLLPRWRGAAPVQRAILEGDEVTGVSVMLLDKGLDSGPVLAARPEPIRVDDDAGSLGARLAEMGGPMVTACLSELQAGTAAPTAQPGAGVTYAAKLSAEERAIDWREPSDRIVRRVRAFAPAPGATTTFRGAALKVLRAQTRPAGPGEAAGEHLAPGALAIGADGTPMVRAHDGSVRVALLEVAQAGRARMSGADWARGARLEREERLA
ncbi:MAG TPA: methionyl-tRNA formyltransferase [Actinomycetota bacterium]|nr:methionyl-tRNA formyltransferase [Actinomycetota bacterium]